MTRLRLVYREPAPPPPLLERLASVGLPHRHRESTGRRRLEAVVGERLAETLLDVATPGRGQRRLDPAA